MQGDAQQAECPVLVAPAKNIHQLVEPFIGRLDGVVDRRKAGGLHGLAP
jgi:hypothetical protein